MLLALGRWGSEVAFPADASAFSPDSLVLALKTLFSGHAAAPAAIIAAAPATLARLLWHGANLEDELRGERIHIEGDRASAESLFELFRAPRT